MKMKTLTLVYRQAFDKSVDYRIDKISNSIEYHPDQVLKKDEVEGLCKSKDWNVTIVPSK